MKRKFKTSSYIIFFTLIFFILFSFVAPVIIFK